VFQGLDNILRFDQNQISMPYQVGILKLLFKIEYSVSLNFIKVNLNFGSKAPLAAIKLACALLISKLAVLTSG
jgi:hypothetical protein